MTYPWVRCPGCAGRKPRSSGSWRRCRCPTPPLPPRGSQNSGQCPHGPRLRPASPTSSPGRALLGPRPLPPSPDYSGSYSSGPGRWAPPLPLPPPPLPPGGPLGSWARAGLSAPTGAAASSGIRGNNSRGRRRNLRGAYSRSSAVAAASPAQTGSRTAAAPRRRQWQAGRGERAVGGDSSASSGLPGRATATTARKPGSPTAGSTGNAGNRGRTTARGEGREQRETSLTAGLFSPWTCRSGMGARQPGPPPPSWAAVVPPGVRRAPRPRGPLLSAPTHKPSRSAQPQNPLWARAAPHPGTEAPKARGAPSLSD